MHLYECSALQSCNAADEPGQLGAAVCNVHGCKRWENRVDCWAAAAAQKACRKWWLTLGVPLVLAGGLGNGPELDIGAAHVQEVHCHHRIGTLTHSNHLRPTCHEIMTVQSFCAWIDAPFCLRNSKMQSRHMMAVLHFTWACICMPEMVC